MRALRYSITLLTAIVLTAGVWLAIPKIPVFAQSLTVPANIGWSDTQQACDGTVNGQLESFFYDLVGDNVTFNITNTSQYPMDITISEAGQTIYTNTLPAGNSANPAFPLNNEMIFQADGGLSAPCQSGHGGPGVLYVAAASGSLSCSIDSNSVWTVTGQFNGVANSIVLYRGSSYVSTIPDNKGGPGIGDATVNLQFAAETNGEVYYLYDGNDSSARLLSQASCPAKTVSGPAASRSTASKATPTSGSPSISTPTTITSPTSNPSAPTVTQTLLTEQPAASTVNPQPGILSTKLDKFVAVGVPTLLLVFVGSWFLNFFGLRLKLSGLIKRFVNK